MSQTAIAKKAAGRSSSGRRVGHGISSTKPRVQSAARTVDILLCVARSEAGLRGVEISEQLQLPRQITYHLLHTLSATGIIRKNEHHRYVLGLAASTIAIGFRRQLAPLEHLAPIVRSIASATGETAYASGWVDDDIVALVSARGHLPIQAAEVPHGYSHDAHARASGKLLLALADTSVRDGYLRRHKLRALTANTITSQRKLLAEFDRIRKRGYAIDDEEFSIGLCCAAVPIAEGGIVLALAAPAERFNRNSDGYLSELRKAANLNNVGR